MIEQLEELYREVILEHYRHPHHHHVVGDADLAGVGQNPLCGDELSLQLKFEGNRVASVGVQARGCSISVASGSMMTDLLVGKTREELQQMLAVMKSLIQGTPPSDTSSLGDAEVLAGVRKFPSRVKCALLPWDALEGVLPSRKS